MCNECLNCECKEYDFSKYLDLREAYGKKAEKIIDRIIGKIKNDSVKLDRKSGMMLSGDDDITNNVWEEYCFTVQEGNYLYQEEYDEYYYAVIDNELRKITTDELELITTQTEGYNDWINNDECDYNILEYLQDDKLPLFSDFEECVMLIKQRLENCAVNYELPDDV